MLKPPTLPVGTRNIGIDMTAAMSMGAETIDNREEAFDGPQQGNALARHEEEVPTWGTDPDVIAKYVIPISDAPARRPGWGMQWDKDKNTGQWIFVPIQSCVRELARDAEELSLNVPKSITEDPSTIEKMAIYEKALLEWIPSKRALNGMSGRRKLKAEIDDTAYAWAQAAKYRQDCDEKRAYWSKFGNSLSAAQRESLNNLQAYGMQCITEAYVMSRVLTRRTELFDPTEKMLTKYGTIPWTFELGALRVLQNSCRKLLTYYETQTAQERKQQENASDDWQYSKQNFYA